MLHYYSLKTTVMPRYRCITSWKNSFLLVLFFCMFTGISISQNTTANSAITDLLNQRAMLIEEAQSTRDIDVQLVELGYRPKAVIHSQTTVNGGIRIEFPIYLLIPADKKDRVIQRLSNYYAPTLFSLEIDTELRMVTLFVNATISSEEIDSIIDHFGYSGHE